MMSDRTDAAFALQPVCELSPARRKSDVFGQGLKYLHRSCRESTSPDSFLICSFINSCMLLVIYYFSVFSSLALWPRIMCTEAVLMEGCVSFCLFSGRSSYETWSFCIYLRALCRLGPLTWSFAPDLLWLTCRAHCKIYDSVECRFSFLQFDVWEAQ